MRFLWQVSLCCLLAGGTALAQRGGGGGFSGGARGGYGGGGVMTPGGGGSMGGGFQGGGSYGGGIGFRNGFRTGFNSGPVGPIYRPGFRDFDAFSNRYYNGLYGGDYGYGLPERGYYNGLYGGDYGRLSNQGFSNQGFNNNQYSGYYGGYWPFYANSWPAYDNSSYVPGYGYNPSEPGYVAYQSSPNVTVIFPPQAPVQPLSAERARPVMREYDQNGLEIRPAGSPMYLIAFKDGTIRAATGYRVDGTTLRYTTPEREDKQAALDTVDRALSLQLNRERQVPFQLPPQ